MKKLIATRPIQYMSRIYNRGARLPTQDGKMVNAWLRAGTAKWEEAQAETEAEPATRVALTAVHLDGDILGKLKGDDLEKLAADLGVDLTDAKTNAERAQQIAALEILVREEGSAL